MELSLIHIFVSQDTNFAMKGFLGFLMRYADEIPVSKDKDYMERHFYRTLNNLLVNKKEYILIYPEQEMWFNYRKPRPPKRGAYFYAAKFNVPIISCFVEMKDMDKDDTEEFKRVKYVLHILDLSLIHISLQFRSIINRTIFAHSYKIAVHICIIKL